PRGNHAAASPYLGDVGQVEIVLVMFGGAQRRRFGVDRMRLLPDIRRTQNAEALGIGGHQSIFDAVVDHLDEMTRAAGSAMQVAGFGGAGGGLLSPRGTRDVADPGSEGFEDRIQKMQHPDW